MPHKNEPDKRIQKIALLLQEDKQVVRELKAIDLDDTSLGKKALIQSTIRKKKSNSRISGTEDIKKLLSKSFLRNNIINHIKKPPQNTVDTRERFILKYFVDLAKIDSVHEYLAGSQNKSAALEDIVMSEAFVLHALEYDSNEFNEITAEAIKNKVTEQISRRDEIILQLTNTLYKSIVFGRASTSRFQKTVPEKKEFLAGNKKYYSLFELVEDIESISDNLFNDFAQNERFSPWIKDNYDQSLAEEIKEAKNKKEFREYIRRRVEKIEEGELRRKPPKGEFLWAAKGFSDMLANKELMDLAPYLASKEEVKTLLLIDRYISANREDLFKKELIDFLLDPMNTIKSKKLKEKLPLIFERADEIKPRFDLATFFQKLIELNKRQTEQTVQQAKDLELKYKSTGISSMQELAQVKASSKKLDRFIKDLQQEFPKVAEPAVNAKSILDERIKDFNDLVSAESARYAQACSRIQTLISSSDAIKNKSVSLKNINTFIDLKEELNNYQNWTRTAGIEVPEHENFLEHKNKFISALDELQENLNTKLIEENRTINQKVESKKWKTESDIQELELFEMDWSDVFQAAQKFYEPGSTEILDTPAKIHEIKQNYVREKEKRRKKIEKFNREMEKISESMRNLKSNPLGVQLSSIFLTSKITNIEKSITQKQQSVAELNQPGGLGHLVRRFNEVKEESVEGINAVKEIVHKKISSAIKPELEYIAKQGLEFTQDAEELQKSLNRINDLSEIASLIEYTGKDAEIKQARKTGSEKIKEIDRLYKKRLSDLGEIESRIENEFTGLSSEIESIEKGHLSTILAKFNSWDELLAQKTAWEHDKKLKEKFKEIKETISEKIDWVKEKGEEKITSIYKDIKVRKKTLHASSKKKILARKAYLSRRKQWLENLSNELFEDALQKPLRSVERGLRQADELIETFKEQVKTKLEGVNQELDKAYDLTNHIDTLKGFEKSIESSAQDIENLKYYELNELLESTKAKSKNRIAELDGIIETRKNALENLKSDNKKTTQDFTSPRSGVQNKGLIDKTDELVESFYAELTKLDRCKEDKVLKIKHKEIEDEINEHRQTLDDMIKQRINNLDTPIKNVRKLLAKRSLQPKEVERIVKGLPNVKDQKEKYFDFNTGRFTEIAEQKILNIDKIIPVINQRIQSLTQEWSEKFRDIQNFAYKEFEFSQEIKKLKDNREELKTIKKYSTALELDLPILETRTKINANIREIRKKLAQKEGVIDKIEIDHSEFNRNVDELLKSLQDDASIRESYRLVNNIKSRVDAVAGDNLYTGDKALLESIADLKAKKDAFEEKLENKITEETAKIDAAVKAEAVQVQTSRIGKPSSLREILQRSDNLKHAKASYRALLRHAHTDILHEKERAVAEPQKEINQKVSKFVNELKQRVTALSKEKDREYRYSQDAEHLRNDIIPENDELAECHRILGNTHTVSTLVDWKIDINNESARLDEIYKKNQEKIDEIAGEIKKNKSLLDELWKENSEGEKLDEIKGILNSLENIEKKSVAEFRPDDNLAKELVKKVDNPVGEIKENTRRLALEQAKEYVSKLEEINTKTQSQELGTLEAVRALDENQSQMYHYNLLAHAFKLASRDFDMSECFLAAEKVKDSLDKKYQEAKDLVSDEYESIKITLAFESYKFTQHINDLKELKESAEKQIEISNALDYEKSELLQGIVAQIEESIAGINRQYEKNIKEIEGISGTLDAAGKEISQKLEGALDDVKTTDVINILEMVGPLFDNEELNVYRNDKGLEQEFAGIDKLFEEITEAVDSRFNSDMDSIEKDIAEHVAIAETGVPENDKKFEQMLFAIPRLNRAIQSYHKFNKGKYAKSVTKRINELQELFNTAKSNRDGFLNERTKRKKSIEESPAKLEFAWNQVLEAEKSESFGKYLKSLNMFLVNLATAAKDHQKWGKADEEIEKFREESKDIFVLKEYIDFAVGRQEKALNRFRTFVDKYKKKLDRTWQTKQDIEILNNIFEEIKTGHAPFDILKLAVYGRENRSEAKALEKDFAGLYDKVRTENEAYAALVSEKTQEISRLQDSITEFDERCDTVFEQAQSFPPCLVDKIKDIDAEFQGLRHSVVSLNSLQEDTEGLAKEYIPLEEKADSSRENYLENLQGLYKQLQEKAKEYSQQKSKIDSTKVRRWINEKFKQEKTKMIRKFDKQYSNQLVELGKIVRQYVTM